MIIHTNILYLNIYTQNKITRKYKEKDNDSTISIRIAFIEFIFKKQQLQNSFWNHNNNKIIEDLDKFW